MRKSKDEIAQLYYSHKDFKQKKGEVVENVNIIEPLKVTSQQGGAHQGGAHQGGANTENIIPDIHSSEKYTTEIYAIEKENKLMEAIFKNLHLKKQLNLMHKKNLLNDKIIEMLKN